MLAEAFILRLETMVRNTHARTGSGRDMRFVPAALPVNAARNSQLSPAKEIPAKES